MPTVEDLLAKLREMQADERAVARSGRP
jgi:hypothetical protein